MKDENTFKDIYDIVVGIGETWGSLTDIARADVLETLGGKRGANQLAAVLNNVDRLKSIYQTSMGSEGSAQREEEAYERSIQYSIDQTKAQLQELAHDFLSSDLLKGLIDSANVFLGVIDKIVAGLGGIGTAIAGLSGMSIFKGTILGDNNALIPQLFGDLVGIGNRSNAQKEILKLFNNGNHEGLVEKISSLGSIDEATQALKGIGKIDEAEKISLIGEAFKEVDDAAINAGEAVRNAGSSFSAINRASRGVEKAKQAFVGLGSVIKNVFTNYTGLGVAGAVATAGTIAYAFYKNYKKNLKEMGQEGAKTWDASQKSLEDYINKYTELQDQLSQEGLSQGEQLQIKQQLYELQKQIVEEYGNAVSGVDLVNGELKEQLSILQEISKTEAERNLRENKKGYKDALKEMRNPKDLTLSYYDDDNREVLDRFSKFISSIDGLRATADENVIGISHIEFDDGIGVEAAAQKVKTISEYLDSMRKDFKDDSGALDTINILQSQIESGYDSLMSKVDEYGDAARTAIETLIGSEVGTGSMNSLKEATTNLTNALLEGEDAAIDKAYPEYLNALERFNSDALRALSTNSGRELGATLLDFDSLRGELSNFNLNDLRKHYMEEVLRDTKTEITDRSAYNSLLESYQEAVDEIAAMDKDLSQTVFGNINLNNRQVLEWNKQNLSRYSKELQSWNIEADEVADSISTILGMSMSFGENETEIAFSPMLQTDHGAELLSRDTVVDYINSILRNVSRDAKGDYVIEDILKRDAVENGGMGLISAVGPEALNVGEYMHLVSQAIEAQKQMSELFTYNLGDVSDSNPFKNLSKASSIKKHADAIKQYGLDIVEVQEIFDKGIHTSEVSKQLFALAQDFGIVFKDNIPTDQALYENFLNALTMSGTVFDTTGAMTQSYSSTVSDMVDQLGRAISSISTLTSILSESSSATGLSAESLESFRAMFGEDANKAIEYTTNGIHINQQAVLDLQKTLNQKTKSDYIQELSKQLFQLSDYNKQIADIQKNGGDPGGLIAQRDLIKKNIQDLRDSIAEYQGAMSDFNMWTQAKNAGSERSMYEEAFGAYESYGEQLDLGWVDNGLREWIHMMTGMENAATASYSEIVDAYDSMVEKLDGSNFSLADFYDVEDGKVTKDGITNFFKAVNEAFGEGFASKGENGWVFNFSDRNIEAMVARWGIGPELIEAIARASLAAGAHGQFGGEDYSSLYYNQNMAAGDVNYLTAHTSSDWKFSGLDLDDKSVESITAGIDLVKGFLESAEGAKADPSTITRAQNLLSYYNDLLEDVETNGKSSQIKAHQAETAARVKMQQEKEEKEAAQKEIEAQKQAAIDQLEANQNNTTATEQNTTAVENLTSTINGLSPEANTPGQGESTPDSTTQEFKEGRQEPKGNGSNLTYTRPDIVRRNKEIEKDNRFDSEMNRQNIFNTEPNKTEYSKDDIEDLSVENLQVDTVSGAAPVNKNDTISTGEGDKKESKSKKKSDESATKATEETADNVGEIENNVAEMMAAIKAANEGNEYFDNQENLRLVAEDALNNHITPEQVYQSAGIEPPTDSSPITKEVNFVANDEEVKEATEEAEKPVEQPVEQTITQRVNAVLDSSNLDTSGTIQASTEDMQAAVEIVANVVGQEELEELKDAEDNLYDKTIQAIAQAIGQGKVQNLIDVVNSLRPNTVTAKANTEGTEAVQNLKRELAGLKDKTITIKTIRRIEEQNAKGSGGSGPNKATFTYNGTAHAQGTAHAGGKWGLERDEDNALINELGEEIVVRGNRWFTVNNGKPAITSLKRDDIVFNHKQSEELLKRGYVSSGHGKMRGRSYANGKNNDLESIGEQIGKGIVQYLGSGNGSEYDDERRTTKKKNDTSKKQDSGGGGNGNGGGGNGGGNHGGGNGGGNTDKSKSNADNLVDWIEILLERLAKSLERLKTAADLLDKYTSKIAKYNEAISQVQTNIRKNEQAEAKYRQKAGSIKIFEKDKKKDAEYKKKIREGDLSIENISDENVRKKIEEYQKW